MKKRAYAHYLRLLAQPTTFLGVGLLICIYSALAYLLIGDRAAAEKDSVMRAENLVRVLEQNLSNLIKRSDTGLLFLRNSFRLSTADFNINEWFTNIPVGDQAVVDFIITDTRGRIIQTTDPFNFMLGENAAIEENIGALSQIPQDELAIGKSVKRSKDGAMEMMLSRRIHAKDGTVIGHVSALIDLGIFEELTSGLELGNDSSVAVTGLDGFVRARFIRGKQDLSVIGQKVQRENTVIGHAFAQTAGTFWNKPGLFETISRLISYRVLHSYPVIAVVTIAEHEVYRRAYENAKIYWATSLLLTCGILVGIGVGARREFYLAKSMKSAEQFRAALQLSEERYRKVESAVNDGIWDWNIATGDDYLSPRWKAILGYADDEIPNIRSTFIERVHPDDLAKVTAAAQAHIDDGKPYDVEYRLRCKNGEYKWVQSRGRAYQDANGHTSRMLGIMTDISERKRTEEELRNEVRRREEAQAALEASEERYRKVESAVNDGIWDRNLLTDEYYLSPRWKAILDFADDELPNRKDSFYGRIHPDDEAAVVAAVRAHLNGGKSYTIDLRLRCKNGDYVWVQSRGKAEFDDAGKPVRMLGTIKDISERKRAEQALLEEARRREEAQAELALANQNLEQRIAARTEELARELRQREEAQMKLAQVQKLEAVGQLTAGIAHDFNNLLSVINGGLEFVNSAAERGLPTDPELIDTAMRATRRGGELVQRLLAFARQAPLKAKAEKVDQLVLDALRLLHRTLGERIEIETCLEAPGALVRVDRNQMINVLVNLALNARDAMPDGGKLIISTSCKGSPWAAQEGSDRWPTGDAVYITVSDTGAGMTDEVRRRAVEPFFTTKPDGVGTGLGLSTVLGFVEQTGGHLEIASQVGVGTQVTVLLPRIEVGNASTEAVAADGLMANGHEKLVLLVEDDPDMRVMTAAQLKSLGYRVQVAADGNEAITLMESPIRFDVALTDIVLPGGVDGLTLVKEALRSRPSMGLLCMTGYDPGRSHRKWLDVQNISLLEKPFTSAQLANALSDVIVQKAS